MLQFSDDNGRGNDELTNAITQSLFQNKVELKRKYWFNI